MSNTWTYREDVYTTLGDKSLDGYDVEATDGSIGTIDEHTASPDAGYLLVDTGFWIFGKKRVLPAGVISQINHDEQKVFVNMTKEQVKSAPDYDDTQRNDQDDWYRESNRDYYDPYVW